MHENDLHDRIARTLSCTATVSITTSGYADRYIRYNWAYSASIEPDGSRLSRSAVLHWPDRDSALSSILLLCAPDGADVSADGQLWRDVYRLVFEVCPVAYLGQWYVSPNHARTAAVRPHVIEAVIHAHQSHFTTEARAHANRTAADVTEHERQFIAWHLHECNRVNRERGRGDDAQFAIDGFVYPEGSR